MTDYNQGTDGVGLNAAGSSGGLIATDYTEATGFFGASAHVQYSENWFWFYSRPILYCRRYGN